MKALILRRLFNNIFRPWGNFNWLWMGMLLLIISQIGIKPARVSARQSGFELLPAESTIKKQTIRSFVTMGTLTGQVRDACTNLPMAGVEVVISGGAPITQTWTDVEGYYSAWLEEGIYTVDFLAPGYLAYTNEATLSDGETVVMSPNLVPYRPCLHVLPGSLEVWIVSGVVNYPSNGLVITNPGVLDLTFLIRERDAMNLPVDNHGMGGNGEWLYQNRDGLSVSDSNHGGALAHPAAYHWEPDFISLYHVLVYADDAQHTAPGTFPDLALQDLGIAYTAHYDNDFAGFETDLSQGDWDLVVFANDNYLPPESTLDLLDAWVQAGGALIAHSWAVHDGHPLWTSLGATWMADDNDPPDSVYWWEPAHPTFNTPWHVPEFTSLESGIYGVYGQHVEPMPGFTALAGYTVPGPAPNLGALLLGNQNTTVFKAFLDGQNSADLDADQLYDGVELWVNLIFGLLDGFASQDVPWLWETPLQGSMEGSEAMPVGVNFTTVISETEPMPPGTYTAELRLLNNDPEAGTLTVPVVMHVIESFWNRLPIVIK
jgi:hypothetical protein